MIFHHQGKEKAKFWNNRLGGSLELFLIIKIINSSTTNFLKSMQETYVKLIQMFRKTGHILVRYAVSQTLHMEALLNFCIVTEEERPPRPYFQNISLQEQITSNQSARSSSIIFLLLSQRNAFSSVTPFVRIQLAHHTEKWEELNPLSGMLCEQARVKTNCWTKSCKPVL